MSVMEPAIRWGLPSTSRTARPRLSTQRYVPSLHCMRCSLSKCAVRPARWMAGSMTDISLRKAAEEKLLHEAIHDVLTGLPNRALFMDLLGRSGARSKRRKGHLFAVLFLDL